MGCGSAKVLQNGAESSSTHQSSSEKKSSKSKRCKARLFGYSSPSRGSLSAKQSALGDSLAKVRAHPKGKAKTQTIARSPSRENPYHEVRLQHNKVRPSTSVYECSSAKQYPNENFRVRTTVSGTSRIRVTLSSDGSMLEIETEKLSNSADTPAAGSVADNRDRYGEADSDDSDGYVRLSPQAAITVGSGSSQITHAQVERFDDGRSGDCGHVSQKTGSQCYYGDNGSEGRKCLRNEDKGWLKRGMVQSRGGNGWGQDGCRKCTDSVRNSEFVNRMSRCNPNNISPSLSSSSSLSLSSSASPNRYDCRHNRPIDVAIIPCHEGGCGMLNETRARSRFPMQPTPVSSPMSPSFMDGFNYECALRGLCTDPMVIEANAGTKTMVSCDVSVMAEGTLPEDITGTSSGNKYLDSSAKSVSAQREGGRSDIREASPAGDRTSCDANHVTDIDNVSSAQQPPQNYTSCIDGARPPQQSPPPPTDISSDRCCSSVADSAESKQDKKRGTETSELARNDNGGAMANGGCHRHVNDRQSIKGEGLDRCQMASSSQRNGDVMKLSEKSLPRNCANNVKKKRTKFWLRKVNSENDKDVRSTGFNNNKLKDGQNSTATKRGHKNNVRRLPGSKCLSFDSATMLESRVSRESPTPRGGRTKTAFVHCVNGSAARLTTTGQPARADLSHSHSYEHSNSSEACSSTSSNRNHVNNTPSCSVQRSDSSGSAFSSDLSSSSKRSTRKNRLIGENTKQQIVEVGLMVSNPLEHQVNYSIALDQDTADTLDAVDEGMELESETSDGRDLQSDSECRAAVMEREGTPTEDIIVEEQTDRQIHITPATTSINVHRDFFNSFEDLYDDEDVT